MNYHKIEKFSVANGTGIRVVLWVSGCSLHCKGCHNPQTWAFDSGKLFDETAKQELFEALDKPYIQGITFSGGHPLENENIDAIYELCLIIKKNFPEKDIWLYTGYNLDAILPLFQTMPRDTYIWNENTILLGRIANIISLCDVVVDGPYIEEQRDITLPFCGSKNQRLIDVKETLKQGQIVQYKINK